MTDLSDRDPCDGCDGTCGDVCPVMQAQRETLDRVQASNPVMLAMTEAVLSAFCKATGEPIVMDAIDAAQRHREALEKIARHQATMRWSNELRCTVDQDGEPWVHWGEIAKRALSGSSDEEGRS